MEKEKTKKSGTEEGTGASKQDKLLFELCSSCCGKAGMPDEMLKMCEGMGNMKDMAKKWKDMHIPSDLRKMCKESC